MKDLLKRTLENEFNESGYKELIRNLFNRFDFSKGHTLKHQFTEAEKQALNDFAYLGTYEDSQNKSLDVLIAELKGGTKVERARSLQRNLIGKYLKSNLKDSALVAFYSKDNPDWRLSFVKMDYRLDEKGVKTEIGTPPKRYSFLVGKTEPSHTAQKQLLPLLDDKKIPAIDEIEKLFSIEKVTKEFYTEIAKKFTELVGGERKIGSKKMVEKGCLRLPSTDNDTIEKEFAVRLIGRLLFCWFLKKKKSDAGVPLIPNVILSSDAIRQYPAYYHSLLEPLFFQVLNTPIEKRDKNVRHNFWNNIPFLNGGLFETHLHDYYEIYYESGISKYINTLKIPDEWFLDLFKIFEIYNFTIDESTTIDVDISVDPEMLGRIFENLLAEINPETGETARKSTGSYYTPRPIVEYMVDESLKQYLLTQLSASKDVIPVKMGIQKEKGLDSCLRRNDSNEIETKISRLLSYADSDIELTEEEKDSIVDALDRVKIIDPACGSGAFPMGILHKMLLILQKIDPESKKWLTRKLARIDNKLLRKELESKLKSENWDYVHKLGIIQNSIYGVDIQPIAVEISKLRFFLSLVVDEKIDDSKPNRGVVPLPNLEFKFVSANSLIGLPKAEAGLAESHVDIEKLKELREAYFTSYGDEKREIERKFGETQHKMFLHALNWQATGSQTYKLSEWNPFADEAASWFDSEWMFGVKSPSPLAGEGAGEGGFDIVIGNPPYVRQEDLKPIKPILEKQGYQVYNSTSDIYTYFYEKGWQVLNESGHLTFITSNKWMRAKYGEKLRKFFKEKSRLKKIIDFGGHKVFESATVDTNILIFQKNADVRHSRTPSCHSLENGNPEILSVKSDFTPQTDLSEYFRQNAITMNQLDLDEKCFTFGDDAMMQLKKKIEQIGTPLKDWDVRIYRGIITGFNEAFIVDNETKERLCKEDPKSTEILKPILRGRDIERYSYKWAGLWLIKIESGWTKKKLLDSRLHGNDKKGYCQVFSANSLKGFIINEKMFQDTYPAIYKHLKSKGEKKGKGKGLYNRDDQGDYWWELRDCDYYDEFEKEKIVYQEMSDRGSFAWDTKRFFVNQTCYILTNANKYVLALLNSRLVYFYFSQVSYALGTGAFRWIKQFVEQITIPKISEKAQQPFISLVNQILAAKKQHTPQSPLDRGEGNADTSALERQIDKMVYKLYNLTPEEIEIVEGKG